MKRLAATACVAACLVSLALCTIAAGDADKPADAPAYTPLFNGKDLAGWHIVNNGQFSVRDGVIFLNRGGGWLRSDKQYKDFELHIVFRFIDAGSNSGIFFRSDDSNGPGRAYQVQTKDGGTSIGSIYTRGLKKPQEKKSEPAVTKAMKPAGEWQDYLITVNGPKVEVKLNGELINTADGLTDEPGHIGLQGEGGTLEFKAIEIREVPVSAKP